MACRWIEDERRDQEGYIFLKETYIFGFFIVSFIKILYFCNSICPMRLWCHLWMTEPMGRALHIERRYVALFLDNRTTTIEKQTRTMLRWLHGVYYRLSVVCCEGTLCPPRTLYGCTIYSCVGVSLSVFCFGCGRPDCRTGRCKHPRFLYIVVNPE